MQIIEASEDLRKQINHFYQTLGYSSGWGQDEIAYCLVANNKVAGCVKIESLNGNLILRGMYLETTAQRKGFGTLLIRYIEPFLNNSTSYCLPFSHLACFYEQIGFIKVDPLDLPEALIRRHKKYQDKGIDVIAMKRQKMHS